MSGEAAERIAGLKKPDMAQAAEQLLAGTGWLPSLLRTGRAVSPDRESVDQDGETFAIAAE